MLQVRRLNVLTGAALAAVLLCGCHKDAPSFVQPNAIKKSDLAGTWYYLQTVVDAPAPVGPMFVGQSSALMKIRFDVQEDHLYARRAYAPVAGAEDAAAGAGPYLGQPLAAWRIARQFDIVTTSDPTGEAPAGATIESEQRPWNERDYIRVDWSQNQVVDYSGLGLDLFLSDGNTRVEPISYWQSDPTQPDALRLERNAGGAGEAEGYSDGEAVYLDVTNQMIVTPQAESTCYVEGGQQHCVDRPLCWNAWSLADCASQGVTLRHAFAKIGPAHDYEPRVLDNAQAALFGLWDINLRHDTYNRQYGLTDTGVHHYAARFNLWQRSLGPGGTPIAFADRAPRTIPYYAVGSLPIVRAADDPLFPAGPDRVFPEDLYDGFRAAVAGWNAALKVAVHDLTGKDPSTLPDVLVACHNPVVQAPAAGADPPACAAGLSPDLDAAGNVINDKNGNPVLRVRAGDPRRSMVYWVNQPQEGGPLGLGPPLYDPETGETIAGHAYVFGAALDQYAARARDLLLLQNGEITAQDFTAGFNVQDWVNQHQAGTANAAPTFAPAEVLALSLSMDFDWARGLGPAHGFPPLDTGSLPALQASLAAREGAIWQFAFNHADAGRDARLGRLVGSAVERAMVVPELAALAGVSPALDFNQLDDAAKLRTSPLRRAAVAGALRAAEARAQTVGVDFASFDDPGLAERLVKLQARFGASLAPHAEEVRQQLRKDLFLAGALHELGHNLGGRHNFRGSWDALNYFADYVDPSDGKTYPGYWNLRTEAVNHPDPGMQAGDGLLHPRWVNKPGGALSQYEQASAIEETQYASIMDYGSGFNANLLGLGLYDKALVKFAYATQVEVFTNHKTDQDSLRRIGALQSANVNPEMPSPLLPGPGVSAQAYHHLPDLFQSGWQGIYQRADVPYSDISVQSLDNMGDTVVTDSRGRPMVPYGSCTDEAAGGLSCQRFDAGADPYEQAASVIAGYANFYVVNDFRRDRQSFGAGPDYVEHIRSRYFEVLRRQLLDYVLLRGDLQSTLSDLAALGFGDPSSIQQAENGFFVDENGWGSFTLAVALGFDTLGGAVAMPNAGWHIKTQTPLGQILWKRFKDDTTPISDPQVRTIGLIDGRFVDSQWLGGAAGSPEAGSLARIGYIVDKMLALDTLTRTDSAFPGRDPSVDVRRYAIGYFLPFRRQMQEKIGALLAGDLQSLAPYFKKVQGDDVPVYPSWSLDDPTIVKTKDQGLIDPAADFTVQLDAALYCLSGFSSAFDHRFADATQIFVVGNGEAPVDDATLTANGTTDPNQLVSHGGNREWFVVTEPDSGKTFAAHATPAEPAVLLSTDFADPATNYQIATTNLRGDAGVRMLEHLLGLSSLVLAAESLPEGTPQDQSFKTQQLAYAQDAYDQFRENIELMRSLQNAFGYAQFKTDASLWSP